MKKVCKIYESVQFYVRAKDGKTVDDKSVDDSNEMQSAAASVPIAENIRSKNQTGSKRSSSMLARVEDNNAGGSSYPRLPKRKTMMNKILHKAQEAVRYASATDSDTPPDLDAVSISSSDELESESMNSPILLPGIQNKP